jgi:hypothetical protein
MTICPLGRNYRCLWLTTLVPEMGAVILNDCMAKRCQLRESQGHGLVVLAFEHEAQMRAVDNGKEGKI